MMAGFPRHFLPREIKQHVAFFITCYTTATEQSHILRPKKKLKIVLSPEMCSNDVTKLATLNGTEP